MKYGVSFRCPAKWFSYSFSDTFPLRLLQYTEYSSLCYTVGLCWLSIPYQIKMTVFLLSCNSFLSVTPVLTCHCKKFKTKMSSNLDFAERIRLSLYQHVGYCVCVCVCVCVCMCTCMHIGVHTHRPQAVNNHSSAAAVLHDFLDSWYFPFLEMTLNHYSIKRKIKNETSTERSI